MVGKIINKLYVKISMELAIAEMWTILLTYLSMKKVCTSNSLLKLRRMFSIFGIVNSCESITIIYNKFTIKS